MGVTKRGNADGPSHVLSRRHVLTLGLGAMGLPLLAACGTTPPPLPTTSAAPATGATVAAQPTASVGSAPAGPSPIASAAPSVVVQTNPKPEIDHATFVYPTLTGTQAYAPVAEAQGFFIKYGVQVQTQYAQAGASTAALISGATQFLSADGVLTTQGFAAGAPIRLIACFDRSSPYAIFSAPEITAPAQMKGKTLAIGQIGDASDVTARVAFRPYGLSIQQDIPVLPGGNSPNRFAALTSGQVGAAVLDEGAFAPQAAARGYNELISISQQGLPWISSGVSTTADFAASNPNTVLAVLKGLLEGIRFCADDSNRDAVLAIMARDLQLAPDDPETIDDYASSHQRNRDDPDPQQAAVDEVLAAFREIDPDRYSSVDGTQLIDHTFVAQLRSSGFLASLGYSAPGSGTSL